MNWRIPDAQEHLAEVIDAAHQSPQLIYDQDKLVAAVVEPDLLQQFLQWRQQKQTPAQAFAELRKICQEENYSLHVPAREFLGDRQNPFLERDN